jgi:hypothetical protein
VANHDPGSWFMKQVLIYPSLVNSVCKLWQGSRAMVRKEYGEIALKTGIAVPLKRMLIEGRMVQVLGKESFSGFKVPKILGWGENYLDFELIDGVLASDALAGVGMSDWLWRWQSIGVGLALAELYLQAHAADIFDGLVAVQDQCANIMNARKCKGVVFGGGCERLWVSMGDVGVKNIILGETHTYLLDFEFAHFSRRARDVGQLVSQLVSLGATDLAAAVWRGYLTVASDAEADLDFWKSAFDNYYGVTCGKD